MPNDQSPRMQSAWTYEAMAQRHIELAQNAVDVEAAKVNALNALTSAVLAVAAAVESVGDTEKPPDAA